MLEKLTSSDFVPHLRTAFRLRNNASQKSVPAELYEVELHKPHKGAAQTDKRSFSLHFRADKNAHLPQGVYTIEHDKLGKIELFLVPIGMRTEHARYEAAFNFAPGEATTKKAAPKKTATKKAATKKTATKKTATKKTATKKTATKKTATKKAATKKTATKKAATKKTATKKAATKKAATKKTATKKTATKKTATKKAATKKAATKKTATKK